jgi:metal-sulfur cluster biosynthetic enzyme
MPAEPPVPLDASIKAVLEGIIDPCSRATGAPAGLVSMGLVGPIAIDRRDDGAHVHVTLYITEPGCMMGAIFKPNAERALAEIAGVASVAVEMDYGHLWLPEQMAPEYRRRLAEIRACYRGPPAGAAAELSSATHGVRHV